MVEPEYLRRRSLSFVPVDLVINHMIEGEEESEGGGVGEGRRGDEFSVVEKGPVCKSFSL